MKIPIITANEPLQQRPVTATTRGAGQTWDAVTQLSGQIQDIGLGIAEKQQQIRMFSDLSKAETDMGALNEGIITDLRNNPNPETYTKDWLAKFTEGKNKIIENTRGSETKSRINYALDRMQRSEFIEQSHYGNVLWNNTKIVENDRSADEYLRLGQESKAYDVYDNMVKTGQIKPEQGAQRKEKANVTMGLNEIMVHPESVEKILNDRKIPIEFQQHLRNVAEVQANKLKLELDRKKTTIAHGALDTAFTVNGEKDFNAMTRQLHNPKFQEQYALTIEQVHSLDIDIRTEEADVKVAQQDRWNQTAIKNFPLESSGKLTTDLINKQVANGDISVPMGRAYLSHLDAPVIKTDAKYYIDTLNKALAGKDVTADINYGIGEGKTLDTAHAAHLTQLQFDMKKAGKEHYASDQWFQLAKQDLANHFGTMEVSPEELFRMKLAGRPVPKKDYDGYSEALSTLMRSIEKNKLTGENIWVEGQKLIKLNSMKKAQGATNITSTAPDKYGFTMGQIKPKGNQTYRYIGENKWQLIQ